MPCTRETPCGGILYDDPQILELARAGIPRRVQKCLAGHEFWEGAVPALMSYPGPRGSDHDGREDESPRRAFVRAQVKRASRRMVAA